MTLNNFKQLPGTKGVTLEEFEKVRDSLLVHIMESPDTAEATQASTAAALLSLWFSITVENGICPRCLIEGSLDRLDHTCTIN